MKTKDWWYNKTVQQRKEHLLNVALPTGYAHFAFAELPVVVVSAMQVECINETPMTDAEFAARKDGVKLDFLSRGF